jgi:2-C-methyl-D-erythritol 2,4-cyclodiphosphate synthase
MNKFRIGTGYDVHRLVEGRKLILGGVEIPFGKGSLGHSDADVIIHAICDAMLGALSLGDLGKHFPDSDKRWKDISSVELLRLTNQLLLENHYRVSNLDVTLILQEPKISTYSLEMRQNIAEILSLNLDRISIKASTTEGLGFIGRGEGLSAQAVCLIQSL